MPQVTRVWGGLMQRLRRRHPGADVIPISGHIQHPITAEKIDLEKIAEEAARNMESGKPSNALHVYSVVHDLRLHNDYGPLIFHTGSLGDYFGKVGDSPESRNALRRVLENPLDKDSRHTRMYAIAKHLSVSGAAPLSGNGWLRTEVDHYLHGNQMIRLFTIPNELYSREELDRAPTMYIKLKK